MSNILRKNAGRLWRELVLVPFLEACSKPFVLSEKKKNHTSLRMPLQMLIPPEDSSNANQRI